MAAPPNYNPNRPSPYCDACGYFHYEDQNHIMATPMSSASITGALPPRQCEICGSTMHSTLECKNIPKQKAPPMPMSPPVQTEDQWIAETDFRAKKTIMALCRGEVQLTNEERFALGWIIGRMKG